MKLTHTYHKKCFLQKLQENSEVANIIKTTHENAIKSGDENVFFIGGDVLMEMCGDDGTVDGCHCTYLGFSSIAKAVGDIVERIINI